MTIPPPPYENIFTGPWECAQLVLIGCAYKLKPFTYTDVADSIVCKAAVEDRLGISPGDYETTLEEVVNFIENFNKKGYNNTRIFSPQEYTGFFRIVRLPN